MPLPNLAPDPMYDVHRARTYPRPALRGALHHLCFWLSLLAAPFLLAAAQDARARVAAAIYAASVTLLFGASGLYHLRPWPPVTRRRLQRLDHGMIFVLIAGTYTPVLLVQVPGPLGLVALGLVWGLALSGLVAHMCWLDAPERLIGGCYLALGWLGTLVLPVVWRQDGVLGFSLFAAGGLLYTVGALGYHWRRPDPFPRVFGFHEVFHTYVAAAAGCHYAAIAFLVL